MNFPISRSSMPLSSRLLPAAALATALLVPAGVLAGGFSVSEVGSRESGRGTAAAALAISPSAIFYNPANIAPQEGLRLQLGGSGLMPRWKHTSLDAQPVESQSKTGVITPPHFAASYRLAESGLGDVALGVGVFVPYGSTFGWPSDWLGREEIEDIALTVFEVAPTLAWRPHKLVAIGASFRYLPASVYMKQGVRFGGAQEGSVELSGSGSGMGAAAGVTFFPLDGLAVAFAWRSSVTLKMEGESNFHFDPPFDTQANDRDVRTEVPLPHNFRIGLAYEPLKDLSLSADFEIQRWKSFKELAVVFVNPDGTEEVSASPRNSKNSVLFHIGGEYRLAESFALRAGYIYDQHTLPEETLNPAPPDSDKHVATLGASVYLGQFGVHANFSNVFFSKRTSKTNSLPGEWNGAWPGGTMAYIFGLSLSANLDLAAPIGTRPVTAPAASATPTTAPASPEDGPAATPTTSQQP
ncbi:MAG: outer membrane protein transport protein [Deltaproteobacteria bacterium]|nr:outer membrane protein transport protein [Deltaproteobacteria bacterium]